MIKKTILITLLITVIAVTAVSGCLSQQSGPQQSQIASPDPLQSMAEPRESSGGGVTITATYIGNGSFDVRLDTHSRSLDYQLDQLATVTDSSGKTVRASAWDGGSGGHHLSGILKFSQFDDSKGFQLVITGVGGVDKRILQW